jgi:phage gp36-like protein
MAYCTQEDILKRIDEASLIQLTDDEGQEIDSEVVARAIADADEEIDSYLSVRYALPFSTTPDRVRALSVDIAIYNLHGRTGAEIPENRVSRYKNAIAFLKEVAADRASLDVPDPSDDDDAAIGVTTSKSDRVFSRGRPSDGSTGTLDHY